MASKEKRTTIPCYPETRANVRAFSRKGEALHEAIDRAIRVANHCRRAHAHCEDAGEAATT